LLLPWHFSLALAPFSVNPSFGSAKAQKKRVQTARKKKRSRELLRSSTINLFAWSKIVSGREIGGSSPGWDENVDRRTVQTGRGVRIVK
jgi:hypothetical protein